MKIQIKPKQKVRLCRQCNKVYSGRRNDSFFCTKKCGQKNHYLNNKERYALIAKEKKTRLGIPKRIKLSIEQRKQRKRDKEKARRMNPKYKERVRIRQKKMRTTPEGKIKMKTENRKRRFSKHVWIIKKMGHKTSDRLKQQLVDKFRDVKSCIYCSSTKTLSLDHIIPLSKGG